jgi:hypothetical protein
MTGKLREKLPVNNLPICSCEWEVRRKAIEYNSLPINDPKRQKVYEEWETAVSQAEWD